jgi:uncharacterized membrane protein YeiH
MVNNRLKSRNYATLWIMGLLMSGAIGGYFTALRAGHPPVRMVFVGAIWGGFMGILFCMETSRVDLTLRRSAGACLGALASCISGLVLEWRAVSILLVGLVAAILGALADRWTRHVSTLP